MINVIENCHVVWWNVKEKNIFILVLTKFRYWPWIGILLNSLQCLEFRKHVNTANSYIEKPVVTAEECSYSLAPILQPYSSKGHYRRLPCTDHLISLPCIVKSHIKIWVLLEMQNSADSKTTKQHSSFWDLYALTEEQELIMHL